MLVSELAGPGSKGRYGVLEASEKFQKSHLARTSIKAKAKAETQGCAVGQGLRHSTKTQLWDQNRVPKPRGSEVLRSGWTREGHSWKNFRGRI